MKGEALHQQALVTRAKIHELRYPDLAMLFAVPNAGVRRPGDAGRNIGMGLKAGVPDLIFPVARASWHGLVIEMKFGKNKTSPAQNLWLAALAAQGWKTAVCYDVDVAWQVLFDYVRLPAFGKTSD